MCLFRKLVLICQPKRSSNPIISPNQKDEEERNTVILLAKLTCMQHLEYEFMEGEKIPKKRFDNRQLEYILKNSVYAVRSKGEPIRARNQEAFSSNRLGYYY